MNKTNLQIHSHALKALARNINAREDVIENYRHRVLENLEHAQAEILLQGSDLSKAYSFLQVKDREEWLQTHCPAVAPEKARRYVAISHRAACDQGDFLKLLCPSSEREEASSDPSVQPPVFLTMVNRVSKVVKFLKEVPDEEWTDTTKDELRLHLDPIVKILYPEKFA
jgi:3-oxoacyl-ACP reductase-like protein